MLGEKIKHYRIVSHLTQKELADKVFVTAQAVSRWENNEVEPSIATLNELAKIFDVSISEFFGEEKPKAEVVVEKEIVYTEAKPVLAVCHKCNKPIYNSSEIRRTTDFNGNNIVFCRSCDEKQKKHELYCRIDYGMKQRKLSFIWGPIFAAAIIAIVIIGIMQTNLGMGVAIGCGVGLGVATFTLSSCLFLKNNFICDMVLCIASWGFVRFPGLIFSLDLDGIVWLITVKLAFWVLGGILAICSILLAGVIGGIFSLFTYPYAIVKSIKNPELSEDL